MGCGAQSDHGLRVAVRGCAPPCCHRGSLMLALHPQPAPHRLSALRSRARTRVPAFWPRATTSPPRPSASGANAAPMLVRIARRAPIICPGAPAMGSAPSCARSAGPPASPSTRRPFVVSHFLPHLNRDAVYRILKAEGLNRLSPSEQTRKPHGTFKDDDVGFVPVDVKHLPKLKHRPERWFPAFGKRRCGSRIESIVLDPISRTMLSVSATAPPANATFTSPSTAPPAMCTSPSRMTRPRSRPSPSSRRALAAFPFRVTHVLTDRGSCFTADAFEAACERHGAPHRKTHPYTPQTNGMLERFNGRVQSGRCWAS